MIHPLALDGWDWIKAFECAGPTEYEWGADNTPDLRRANPQDTTTSLAPFQRKDVALVHAFAEGEPDEASWLCLGKLNDGRWFLLRAGCDYTGWDCQSDGCVDVAPDLDTLLSYGASNDERERLGV